MLPSIIEANSDVLLENNILMVSIENFVSSHAEKKSNQVKKEETLAGLGRKIRELPPLLQPHTRRSMTTFHPMRRKIDVFMMTITIRRGRVCLRGPCRMTLGVCHQMTNPRKLMIHRARKAQRKGSWTELLVVKSCD